MVSFARAWLLLASPLFLLACHRYERDVETVCDPWSTGSGKLAALDKPGLDGASKRTLLAEIIDENLRTKEGHALFSEVAMPGGTKTALAHWRSEAARVGMGQCKLADQFEAWDVQGRYEGICFEGGVDAYRAKNPSTSYPILDKLSQLPPAQRDVVLAQEAKAVGVDCAAERARNKYK